LQAPAAPCGTGPQRGPAPARDWAERAGRRPGPGSPGPGADTSGAARQMPARDGRPPGPRAASATLYAEPPRAAGAVPSEARAAQDGLGAGGGGGAKAPSARRCTQGHPGLALPKLIPCPRLGRSRALRAGDGSPDTRRSEALAARASQAAAGHARRASARPPHSGTAAPCAARYTVNDNALRPAHRGARLPPSGAPRRRARRRGCPYCPAAARRAALPGVRHDRDRAGAPPQAARVRRRLTFTQSRHSPEMHRSHSGSARTGRA
jgi:hypothetical protein